MDEAAGALDARPGGEGGAERGRACRCATSTFRIARAHRTPRWRGITLVHEMKARGINVSFASDNTRDPFYAYGDMDMVEVLREATRIGHLDHSGRDWIHSVLTNPARACGFRPPSLAPGAPADLVIFRARTWTELFARPQSDRIVIRGGPADRPHAARLRRSRPADGASMTLAAARKPPCRIWTSTTTRFRSAPRAAISSGIRRSSRRGSTM